MQHSWLSGESSQRRMGEKRIVLVWIVPEKMGRKISDLRRLEKMVPNKVVAGCQKRTRVSRQSVQAAVSTRDLLVNLDEFPSWLLGTMIGSGSTEVKQTDESGFLVKHIDADRERTKDHALHCNHTTSLRW